MCPACGHDVIDVVEQGETVVCLGCGHGWSNRATADNAVFESPAYASWRVANGSRMDAKARRYLDEFYEIVQSWPASAVELGCATGEVLGMLSARGTQCWGADPSVASIRHARRRFPGVSFTVGDVPAPPRPVAAVMGFHVFEHTPDPEQLLRSVRGLVELDGLLYLRVPNHDSLARRVFRTNWPDYMPGHVHHFTPTSIDHVLRRAGWEPLHVGTAANSWPWLGGLKRALTGGQGGQTQSGPSRPPSARRLQLLDWMDRALSPLLQLEVSRGVGNELVVVARRR